MRSSLRDGTGGRAHVCGRALLVLPLALAVAMPGALAAQTEGVEGQFAQDAVSPSLSIGGSAEYRARAYLGDDALDAIGDTSDAADALESDPSLRLDFDFKAAGSELEAKVRVDEAVIEDNPADSLEEATLRSYLGNFIVEAGKMKVVWGKGDKLHVLDLFNANDYSDFIIPDYIDRRLAEGMLRVTWNAPAGARLEAVWTPVMTPDRIPTEGTWAPANAKSLAAAATSYVENLALSAYTSAYATVYAATSDGSLAGAAALAAAQAVTDEYSDASDLLPDVATLDYGQYGLRLTFSVGGVDLGASYYLGHYKTPSVHVSYGLNALGQTVVTGFEANYDRLQSFGVEAATALGPLNLRGEAAYYLTDDIAGDDPEVKNNSLNWLAGFDVDLPLGELNLNVQTIGSYILGSDDITATNDVDYDADDRYTNDKIVVRLSDSFDHEKIVPELAALWGIERDDFILMPKCSLTLRDDMKLELSGAAFLGSSKGEFGAFIDNHFVQARFTYSF